jgi:hypothetical protein
MPERAAKVEDMCSGRPENCHAQDSDEGTQSRKGALVDECNADARRLSR